MGGMILVGDNRSSQLKAVSVDFIYLRSHMDWPGIKPRPLQWEASN